MGDTIGGITGDTIRGISDGAIRDVTAHRTPTHLGRRLTRLRSGRVAPYSTVTVLARFRGWSTFSPLMPAMWYASSCSGITAKIGARW